MKNHKLNKSSFKRSIALLLVMTIAIITPIACSDLRSPSGLSEEELMKSSIDISAHNLTINGKEIWSIPSISQVLPPPPPSPPVESNKSVQENEVLEKPVSPTESTPNNEALRLSQLTVSHPATSIILFGAKEFGSFAISPMQFEGATLSGNLNDKMISFTVNELNVEIRAKEKPFMTHPIELWVRHYPEKRTISARISVFPHSALESTLSNMSDLPPNQSSDSDKEDYFVVVEQMPKLIGGMAGLHAKVIYPEMAKRAGIEGRVTVQFVVSESGDVENAKILRGIGGGCDEEALAAVRNSKFEPGLQRGRPVRVQMSLPIVFRLTNADM